MQFRVYLLHGSVNVLLNVEILVNSGMFVAIEEVACLAFSSKIFLGQARWVALNVFKLEVIDLCQPTAIEVEIFESVHSKKLPSYSLVVGEVLMRQASLPDSNLFAMVTL